MRLSRMGASVGELTTLENTMDYSSWGERELIEELERRDALTASCKHCGEPMYATIRSHHHTENGVDVTGHN